MNLVEIEQIWQQYPHFVHKEKRNEILSKLVKDSSGCFTIDKTKFFRVPFSKKIQQAFELHSQVLSGSVGNWQKVLVDLLLFRVDRSESLRQSKISNKHFKELDALVAAFSSLHSPDLIIYSNQQELWHNFCFTKNNLGNPFNNSTFAFNIKIYKEMIYSNYDEEEAIEIVAEMECELPKRDNILSEAIKEFNSYNFFQQNEIVSVHYLDDSSDSHGFIRMPWKISIGKNYALVELRHGTWY